MQRTKVLIVDDSLFFRKRLNEVLSADPNIEVVGFAPNGREALGMAEKLSPDVITMDIEMPVMDGITAVREIMRRRSIPILMLSSFTTEGAKATLDALDAGAVDFVPKRLSDLSDDHEQARRQLCARIRNIGSRRTQPMPSTANRPVTEEKEFASARNIRKKIADINSYRLIMIGASTGGPPVVQEIIKSLPDSHNVPIVVIQHMPESFTGPFADRLNDVSRLTVGLAKNGEVLRDKHVYIAPGGHQLTFVHDNGRAASLSVKRSGDEYTYKPCVDVSFRSAADTIDGRVLAIVLTGMGSDGTDGARVLKRKNATVIVQNKESSVVYGMPMMVAKAGLADLELSAADIALLLAGKR